MSEAEETTGKGGWLTRFVYVMLALGVIINVWQRLPAKTRREAPVVTSDLVEPYVEVPMPPPLTVSPNASRLVRWCRVQAVLERRCQRCHGTPTTLGAPFPLVTFADTQREHPPLSGQRVFERMGHVISHRIMPPVALPLEPPVEPLDEDEKDIVLAWLQEGAIPLGGATCGSKAPSGAATGAPAP